MQIKIDLKIFVIFVLFLLLKNIEIYVLLMIFAFIHEMGHLLCGILLGYMPKKISIMPCGFNLGLQINYTDYNIKIKKGNMVSLKKILIALAGPLTNCIIILFFTIIKNKLSIVEYENIIYSNILLIVVNLFPIYPLDGGRILKEIIHIFKGLRESYSYIYIINNVNISILTAISSIAILYYKNIAILLVIIYLWILVYKYNKQYELKEKMYQKIDKMY